MIKKILFSLLFLSVIPAFSFSQDYRLGLGLGQIRYDHDSALIKFNYKLGRELNAQLFNFNGAHFYWSTSGLNLQEPVNHDSVWSKVFSVKRDTGDGEFSPYKSRVYSVKKNFYANYYSFAPFELMLRYRSFESGSEVATDSVFIINHAFEQTASYRTLSSSFDIVSTYTFPSPGYYYVVVEYDYNFEAVSGLGTATLESIESKLVLNSSSLLVSSIHNFTYPKDDEFSFSGRGFLSAFIAVRNVSHTLTFEAKHYDAVSGATKSIDETKITAILIK